MAVGISKYHFEKPTHSLGASVFAGQLYLIEQKGMNKEALDNLTWYQLFGDPSLLMRTDAPKSIDATYRVTHMASNSVLELKLRDKLGNALGGLVATVSYAEHTQAPITGVTDSSGQLVLNLSSERRAQRQSATLTITGYNTETFSRALEYR